MGSSWEERINAVLDFFLVYHICVSVTYVLSFLINRCDKYRVRKIKMDEMFMIVSTVIHPESPSGRIIGNYSQ